MSIQKDSEDGNGVLLSRWCNAVLPKTFSIIIQIDILSTYHAWHHSWSLTLRDFMAIVVCTDLNICSHLKPLSVREVVGGESQV